MGNGLAGGCQLFYRKIYVFYSVKYVLVFLGDWDHLESFGKQRSVNTVQRTLRSRDFNGEYYNFINQVISMLEKIDISTLTRPISI